MLTSQFQFALRGIILVGNVGPRQRETSDKELG